MKVALAAAAGGAARGASAFALSLALALLAAASPVGCRRLIGLYRARLLTNRWLLAYPLGAYLVIAAAFGLFASGAQGAP